MEVSSKSSSIERETGEDKEEKGKDIKVQSLKSLFEPSILSTWNLWIPWTIQVGKVILLQSGEKTKEIRINPRMECSFSIKTSCRRRKYQRTDSLFSSKSMKWLIEKSSNVSRRRRKGLSWY